MPSQPDVVVDVAIVGGGIAGLWLQSRLQADGFSTALLERDALGAGQSVASQGIIHGGAKYTLGFALDGAVGPLRDMPHIWKSALERGSTPDLSGARALSEATHLWIPSQLGSGLIAGFSRLFMRSRVRALKRAAWPEALADSTRGGSLYALDELVVDVPSILAALQAAHLGRIRRAEVVRLDSLGTDSARLRAGDLTIEAQRVVLTAGAGNAGLLEQVGVDSVPQQLRPLHQLMIAGMKNPLYVHCVGRNTRPLATITAHPLPGDGYVWYVGGLLAEEGVDQSPEQLIEAGRNTLPELIPGLDLSAARFATCRVDRAEGSVPGGRRPDGPIVVSRDACIVAWPTKLALAPALADLVGQELARQGCRPGPDDCGALTSLSEPTVAQPPWEAVERWS